MHDSFPILFEESQAIPLCFPSFSGNGEEARRAWEKQENASQVKKRLPTLSSTVTLLPLSYLRQSINGQVSEWSNEHAWKVCVLATVPRVRIPPCPPLIFHRNVFVMSILRFFFVGRWGRNGEKSSLLSPSHDRMSKRRKRLIPFLIFPCYTLRNIFSMSQSTFRHE